MKTRLLVLVAIIAASVAATAYQPQVHPQREISIEALGPRYTVDELRTDADLIIVARAIEQTARWNSADNQPWLPVEADPNKPLIFSRTELDVVRVLKGDHAGGSIEVWTVGGSVDGARMRFGNAPEVRVGDEYLLMLDRVEIPMREGTEPAWLPIALGQGIFVSTADGFENAAGETALESSSGQ